MEIYFPLFLFSYDMDKHNYKLWVFYPTIAYFIHIYIYIILSSKEALNSAVWNFQNHKSTVPFSSKISQTKNS